MDAHEHVERDLEDLKRATETHDNTRRSALDPHVVGTIGLRLQLRPQLLRFLSRAGDCGRHPPNSVVAKQSECIVKRRQTHRGRPVPQSGLLNTDAPA